MITGLIKRFFFSLQSRTISLSTRAKKKMYPATNDWNKNIISWLWPYFRSINLIPSWLLAPSHSDLKPGTITKHYEVDPPLVFGAGNHRVYLWVRRWHGACFRELPLSVAGGPDKSCPGWSCQQGEEVRGVRTRVSAEEWCHFSMRRRRASATAEA